MLTHIVVIVFRNIGNDMDTHSATPSLIYSDLPTDRTSHLIKSIFFIRKIHIVLSLEFISDRLLIQPPH
jgi:hypothetical protein